MFATATSPRSANASSVPIDPAIATCNWRNMPGMGSEVDTRRRWLLVGISTAGASGTLRVQVWRKLRSLGALYVQQSVCLLPALAPVRREVGRLADRVRHQGGSARVLRIELADAGELAGVIAELNTARDAEYAELLERLPSFSQELAMERVRGRATYAEVEENEADLQRFQSWLSKIASRDYFDAPGGAAARTAVVAAAAELEAFEAEALRVESPVEAAPSAKATSTVEDPDGPQLRIVEGQ